MIPAAVSISWGVLCLALGATVAHAQETQPARAPDSRASESRPRRRTPEERLLADARAAAIDPSTLFDEDPLFDDAACPQWFVAKVVDAESGEPLANAAMSLYAEHDIPEPPVWSPVRVARADGSGWIRVRFDDLQDTEAFSWVTVEAAGHGPAFAFSWRPDGDPIELPRSSSIPVDVRDVFGRPVPNARVSVMIGCGHTPDVRIAHTDERGRCVLPDMTPGQGYLWVVASGTTSEYEETDSWYEGGPPLLLRVDPSPDLVGTLTSAGRPLSGIVVGIGDWHRGPWTTTDAAGRFRLSGAMPRESPEISVVLPGEQARRYWPCPTGGSPPVIDVLSQPPDDPRDAPAPPTVPVSRFIIEPVGLPDATWGLFTERGRQDVSSAVWHGDPIMVPLTGPAAIEASSGSRRSIMNLPKTRTAEGPPVRLNRRWLEPARIIGTLVDWNGQPTSGLVAISETPALSTFDDLSRERDDSVRVDCDGKFTVTTDLVGPGFLLALGTDVGNGVVQPIVIPEGDGVCVDVGRPQLRARRPGVTFRVSGSARVDPTRPFEGTIRYRHRGREHSGSIADWSSLPLNLERGALVSLEWQGGPPLRRVCAGMPAIDFVIPRGQLEVAVTDSSRSVLADARLLVDGRPFGFSVGGIPDGRHEVVVTAPGYRAAVSEITWQNGETVRRTVVLAKR